jgi:hypothetical protein
VYCLLCVSPQIFCVKIAKILGKEDVAKQYEALYKQVVKTFQETFFAEDGTMTAQTQTAHILALHFNLAPKHFVGKTVEKLKNLLAEHDGHLVTGFVVHRTSVMHSPRMDAWMKLMHCCSRKTSLLGSTKSRKVPQLYGNTGMASSLMGQCGALT